MAENLPHNWLFGISPEGFGAVGAMVNFAVAWFVSQRTPDVPEEIKQLVENIRIPAGR